MASTRELTGVSLDPGTQEISFGDRSIERKLLYSAIFFFTLNLFSALLFDYKINRPVYDEPYHLVDLHLYYTQGLSVATVRAQTNASGPTSYLWMVAGTHLLGGNELRGGRVGILFSWILLAGGIFAIARYSQFPGLWYGALLVALIFPHTVEATATLLTEGPALFFSVLGALAWVEFASRPNVTGGSLLVGIAGGLAIGLSITCRQYDLALLPACAIAALYEFMRRPPSSSRQRMVWLASVAGTLVVAVVPVLMMAKAWNGFSSPGMVAGTSYPNWQSAVGLNAARPLIAAFYVAVYLVPLTFPAMARVKRAVRWSWVLIALLGGALAGNFNASLLEPGPLRTITRTLARSPGGHGVLVGLIATLAIYNLFSLCELMWEERSLLLSCPPAVFALLTILFSVAEQVGVGGNVPFYDRYLLLLAPFLGLTAFSLLPRLTYPRLLALAVMSVAGHLILWRYAFGS